MYDAQYHEAAEEKCDRQFTDFVENSSTFNEVKRLEKYSHIDYRAKDCKGRKCNVELKNRLTKHDQYPTIMIEPNKFWLLLERWLMHREIPLYINFHSDEYISLFDLRKWQEDPSKLNLRRIKVRDYGYGEDTRYETYRYELPVDCAYQYRKDERGKWRISK